MVLTTFGMEAFMFEDYWRTVAAVVGLSVVMASAGCLVSGHSDTTYTGINVAQSTFEQIKPGSTTIGWVHATLGEANSKTRDGDDEVWKYTCTQHTDSGSA